MPPATRPCCRACSTKLPKKSTSRASVATAPMTQRAVMRPSPTWRTSHHPDAQECQAMEGPAPRCRGPHAILNVTRRLRRKIWKRWTGYHRRSLVETKMRCLKLLGERVMARGLDAKWPSYRCVPPCLIALRDWHTYDGGHAVNPLGFWNVARSAYLCNKASFSRNIIASAKKPKRDSGKKTTILS